MEGTYATAIRNIQSHVIKNDTLYDISGRAIGKTGDIAQQGRGVYIADGKKFIRE